MKKTMIFLAVTLLCASMIFAQGNKVAKNKEKQELVVFAAASLTETLNQIKKMYEKENPNVIISYNFDSSGTLKTQIEQGADADLFISAATKQMNALKALYLVDVDSEIDLLENKTTLAVPNGNPKKVKNFNDLSERLKKGELFIAIGNSDVPVGQYTQKIFGYYNINENDIKNSLSYASNVKEVTTQVKKASVDCGIIYQTDAFSAGLEVVDKATAEMTGGRVVYPAAVLAKAKNKAEAQKFLNYLKGNKAKDVFISVGFSPLV